MKFGTQMHILAMLPCKLRDLYVAKVSRREGVAIQELSYRTTVKLGGGK